MSLNGPAEGLDDRVGVRGQAMGVESRPALEPIQVWVYRVPGIVGAGACRTIRVEHSASGRADDRHGVKRMWIEKGHRSIGIRIMMGVHLIIIDGIAEIGHAAYGLSKDWLDVGAADGGEATRTWLEGVIGEWTAGGRYMNISIIQHALSLQNNRGGKPLQHHVRQASAQNRADRSTPPPHEVVEKAYVLACVVVRALSWAPMEPSTEFPAYAPHC